MASTTIRYLSAEVWKVIYDKQNELQKQKLRRVSIDQTIDILLKDAYLRDKTEKKQ